MNAGWARLQCDHCESEDFVQVVHLRWAKGGGTVEEPNGFQCVACHAFVKTVDMIGAAQIRESKRQLKAMQEELGIADEPAVLVVGEKPLAGKKI